MTEGNCGHWNDKTLMLFDEFAVKLKKGQMLSDVKFCLSEQEIQTNRIRQRKHKGAWQIVDNGCLNWSTTVPPFKNPLTCRQFRWSKWLESMCNNVECVFGILNGEIIEPINTMALHHRNRWFDKTQTRLGESNKPNR